MKNTLVIGASLKTERYSNIAIHRLREKKHPVFAFGPKRGKICDVDVASEWDSNWLVDTVTLYINPKIQESYYSKIIALKPKRVIFNPGTENEAFEILLKTNNISFERA